MAGAILAAARTHVDVEFVGVVSRSGDGFGGKIRHCASLDDLPGPVDVVIDFSLPAGTVNAARWCAQSGVALLSGVTGLEAAAQATLEQVADTCAVMWCPNMSRGVNVMAALCGEAATALPANTEVTIHDEHHQWKKDAPSGTALLLGQAIEGAENRTAGAGPNISYTSVREGEVIGRHTVTFKLEGELLVLHHDAQDRSVFASGALDAARWLSRQQPGRYTAADWISGSSGQTKP